MVLWVITRAPAWVPVLPGFFNGSTCKAIRAYGLLLTQGRGVDPEKGDVFRLLLHGFGTFSRDLRGLGALVLQ